MSISKYRTGSPRYGRKDDGPVNSEVTTYTLSPEELARYQNGEMGGTKMLTAEKYEKLRSEGKSNEEIAKEHHISVATLYVRKREWAAKKETVQTVETPVEETNETPVTVQLPDNLEWREKYKRIKEEYDRLNQDYVEFQEEIERLNEEKSVLQKEIEELRMVIETPADTKEEEKVIALERLLKIYLEG